MIARGFLIGIVVSEIAISTIVGEQEERICTASTARIALLLKHMEKQGPIVRSADANDSTQAVIQMAKQGAPEIDRIAFIDKEVVRA